MNPDGASQLSTAGQTAIQLPSAPLDPVSTAQTLPASGEMPDPLAQLRDIYLPPEPSVWPPAMGWWILLLLSLLLVVGIGRFCWRRHQARRYRKLAHQELKTISHQALSQQSKRQINQQTTQPEDDLAEELVARQYLQQVNQLLRRTALVAFPAQTVASLSGEEWCEFLAQSSGIAEFTTGAGQVLRIGPYQADVEVNIEVLQQLSKRWIDFHSHDQLRRRSSTAAVTTASGGQS